MGVASTLGALMSRTTPIVFVFDDDVSVRESLELLIREAGWQPETFESAQEFLVRPRALVPSCLVLDIALPGLNGLQLQERIAADRAEHAYHLRHGRWRCANDSSSNESRSG